MAPLALERVGENLLRYNVLDLRRVAVHFRQLVVVSLILWLILRMGSQKQHGFTASQLKFDNQVVADMVRLPGVLLSPVPLTRDEVGLGATFQSQSIYFCSPRSQ